MQTYSSFSYLRSFAYRPYVFLGEREICFDLLLISLKLRVGDFFNLPTNGIASPETDITGNGVDVVVPVA
jgi:hypothetical protein